MAKRSNESVLRGLLNLAHAGTRRQSIIVERAKEENIQAREAASLREFAEHPAVELHLREIRRQRDDHRALRNKHFEKHLMMVGHSAWEEAMDYILVLFDRYKSFQPVGETEDEE